MTAPPRACAPSPAVPGRRRSPREFADRTRRRRIALTLAALTGCAALALLAFCFVDLRGSWEYALQLRLRQVASLGIVGISVGVSAVVFQTIAGNQVLTPGVMGFDALYLLLQTLLVVVFGSGAFLALTGPERFVLNALTLTAFGTVLFAWLFRPGSRDLYVLVLVGMVLGTMFGSLTSLASRILSPDDFLTISDVMFASFATADPALLAVTGAVTVVGVAALVGLRHRLDVLELGYDAAVGLGVGYRKTVLTALAAVTTLVASATALVGPMTFLGLIVACLARQLMPTIRHAVLIPAAAATGVICTVAGQLAVVQIFGYATTLSVIVNFVGGVYFVLLLLRAGRG